MQQKKLTLRLYDNRAGPVSWDPSIVMPGSRDHACRAARQINQAKIRTAGYFPGSFDQALTVICIVTHFARESFGVCRFHGSCIREYDLI